MEFHGKLKNNESIKYTGRSSRYLLFNSIASIKGNAEIENNSNAYINFKGKLNADSKLKCSGASSSGFYIYGNVSVEGNVELYNDSSSSFSIENCNIPNGTVIKNISKSGTFALDSGGNGFIEFEPNTEFIIENSGRNTFYCWGDLKLNSGQINISGEGPGLILIGTYGGLLNLIIDGDVLLEMYSLKNDWFGETIRFKGYTVGSKIPSRRCYIKTNNIGNYLDVESCVYVNLYGSFDDNTKIRIDGSSSLGKVNLYGDYSGLVSLHMNCSNHSAGVVSYNDKLEDLTYTAKNQGILYIKANANLGKGVVVNNLSKYRVNLESGANIGDNVVINVREDYPSNLYIKESIPAGSTVDY